MFSFLFFFFPASQTQTLYVAIDDHAADSDDDLMFLKGEMITVLRKINDTTWEGECEGITGVFPAKLVKPAGAEEGQADAPASRMTACHHLLELSVFTF
jgi:hypothetical protein